MCLTPVRLRTNAKYFTVDGHKRFYMDVPCGHCSECNQMKKNEWYVRNYYEAQATWLKNGYILFDTLTYADEHLPSVSKTLVGQDVSESGFWLKCLDWTIENHCSERDLRDVIRYFKENAYSCFNYNQVQNFLKLLRIRLERAGYDVKENLRYFIASEYGHDQTYIDNYGKSRKGTTRPHYHVLFYCSDPKLSPLVLSQAVADAWIYGRTDGYPYRGRAYVFNNTFGPKFIKDPNRLAGVQYYVTKYVCKDYEFAENIDVRISHVLRDIYGFSFNTKDYSDRRHDLHRFMDQFHRQSLHFGLTALCNEDVLKMIWSEGNIVLPDKDKVSKKFPVPMYYVRKLFQACVKDSEGSLHWIWNDYGLEWKKSRMSLTVGVLEKKMIDWYQNLSVYTDEPDNWRSKVDSVLAGRSFHDYAEYMVYYRHRLYSGDVPTKDEVIGKCFLADPEKGDNVAIKYGDGYVFKDNSGASFYFTVDDMMNNCVLDDRCSPEWSGFDLLYSIYCSSMRKWNDKKEKAYQEKLEMVKRMKKLGFKTKRKD